MIFFLMKAKYSKYSFFPVIWTFEPAFWQSFALPPLHLGIILDSGALVQIAIGDLLNEIQNMGYEFM